MKAAISLAQMQIAHGNPQKNLARAAHWIAQASHQGSNLILFPELWTTGYDLQNRDRHSKTNQVILHQISALAREHNIWIGGSYLLQKGKRFYNTFVVCSPDGSDRVAYDKIHLFRLMDEHLSLGSVNALMTASLPWGATSLAICYDLRFPEMFRRLALTGAQLVLLVAEWPRTRVIHWQTLLKARAIENQMFVVAVNSVGTTGEETFGGYSAIIDPWGSEVACGSGQEEGLVTATIDLDLVTQIRQTIPIFTDRRPELYG
ncbi:MAG: carbon-nitrogen family hydrolase, partial [Anaerolineaceae bacterium]|nr:carbon-nitrogen family hydrolase [Anaerolineaceae bacterium]